MSAETIACSEDNVDPKVEETTAVLSIEEKGTNVSSFWDRVCSFWPLKSNGESKNTKQHALCTSGSRGTSTRWVPPWKKRSLSSGGYRKMSLSTEKLEDQASSDDVHEKRGDRNHEAGPGGESTDGADTSTTASSNCLAFSTKLRSKSRRHPTLPSGTLDRLGSSNESKDESSRSIVDIGPNQATTVPNSTSQSQVSQTSFTNESTSVALAATNKLLDTPVKSTASKPASAAARSPMAQPTLSQALLAEKLHLLETKSGSQSQEMTTPLSIPGSMMSPDSQIVRQRLLQSPIPPLPRAPQPRSHERTRSLDNTTHSVNSEMLYSRSTSMGRSFYNTAPQSWQYPDGGFSPDMWSYFLDSLQANNQVRVPAAENRTVTPPWLPRQSWSMTPNSYNYMRRRPPYQMTNPTISPQYPPPSGDWSHEKALKAKQINQVKRSAEYKLYITTIPPYQRAPGDPQTPRIENENQDWCAFQNQLREWRQAVNQKGHSLRLLQVVKQSVKA